jgi:hypothetical protein
LAIGAATKLPIASIAVYGDALTARIVTAKGGAGEGVFREMPRIIGHCPQKSFTNFCRQMHVAGGHHSRAIFLVFSAN